MAVQFPRRRRLDGARCPNCDYDLTGLHAGRECPECGQWLDRYNVKRPGGGSPPFRVLWRWGMRLIAGLLLVIGIFWTIFWPEVAFGGARSHLACYTPFLVSFFFFILSELPIG
jgi:hypothetical protein